MITILSGGTGTPKLLQGIKQIVDPSDLNIIVNTLENNYYSGIYITPDIDTVLYTMSDKINNETWYGVEDDTFITNKSLADLGYYETLKIGDQDRAFKIHKTLLLNNHTLSESVDIQTKILKIKSKIRPMSNEKSNVFISTSEGKLEFHDFLINKRSAPHVLGINYNTVNPAPGLLDSLKNSDTIIIGPSNPITSISPIINMQGVINILKKKYVIAISPIISHSPLSGPADKFLKASNVEVSPKGVAHLYSDFLDKFIIDTKDFNFKKSILNFINEISLTNIKMNNINDKITLAQTILDEIK